MSLQPTVTRSATPVFASAPAGQVATPVAQSYPGPFSLAFDRAFAPGTFDGPPPDYVPYRFQVSGYPISGFSHHRPLGELSPQPAQPPFFAEKDGNLLLVYLAPSTPSGRYTLTVQTAEGQATSATFVHNR